MSTILPPPTAGPWYGCDAIEMRYYHDTADPDLVWNDLTFNYYDIESALWDMFCEEHPEVRHMEIGEIDDEFGAYVRAYAVDYLADCVAGGYFAPGSKSWHNRCETERVVA